MKTPHASSRLPALIGPPCTIAALLLVWTFLKWQFDFQDYVLPSPRAVLDAFLTDPVPFLRGCAESAQCAVAGFLIAAVAGIAIGSVISFSRTMERSIYPLTLLFQMVPLIAIAPLLVLWLGYGRPAIIASAAIVAVFPIIANTLAGLRARDEALVELFRVLGASRFTVWWKLALPSAVTSIVTGLGIAAGLATIGTICGEFLAGIAGENAPLGVLITTGLRNFQTDRVFVSVVLAALVGFTVFGAVSLASRLLLSRWTRHAQPRDAR